MSNIVDENLYDTEKREKYVYDPELLQEFFKNLWEKENQFLKSVGVEPQL